MKSVIKTPTVTKEQALTYPVLMKYVGNGSGPFVVLFSDPNSGTVVWSENPNQQLGERTFFISISCDTFWERFDGTLTLSND